jgi:hypothetical protein
MMQRLSRKIVLTGVVALCFIFGVAPQSYPQSRRQVKVVVESQQSGNQSQTGLGASGGVIIRRGNAYPSGRITGDDRHTTVQRSTGIFTLVQDGAESILTVATKVPYNQAAYYYDYAAGAGYIQRQLVFTDVGTSLRVSARILPDNQVKIQLTPRISYFSAERSGAIDFTEATTELIVPNGQPVSLGGSTTKIHEITRQILGYQNTTGTSETSLTVTAIVQ